MRTSISAAFGTSSSHADTVIPEDGDEGALSSFEHDRHVSSSLDRRRRLRTEETAANDRDLARGCELLEELVQSHGVVVGPQCHELAGRLVGQRSRSSAGRDHDVRAFDPRAARELDRRRLHVERDGSLAEQDGREGLRELLGRRQRRLVGSPATGEHLLREWGSIVGRMQFVANEGDRPVKAVATQEFNKAPSRDPGTDDDDVIARRKLTARTASECSRAKHGEPLLEARHGQDRIALAHVAHRQRPFCRVEVTGEEHGLVAHLRESFVQRHEELSRVAPRKVGAPAPVNEERVTTQQVSLNEEALTALACAPACAAA